MKFSPSAPTLLAVAVALAAQAVSVDAKLGSTDWDVRGDTSDADQALRQLKGGGTNGTGKSKSKSGGDDGSSCGGTASGAAAAALTDQVCAAEGLLYPTRTGSYDTVSGPTFNSQAVLGAVGNCGPPTGPPQNVGNGACLGGYDACTTCIAQTLEALDAYVCQAEAATLAACGLFGIRGLWQDGSIASCPADPQAEYQCCLQNEAVYDAPFWYNSDGTGLFKFTKCAEEIATRGYGSFQGIIRDDNPTAQSTIEYWGVESDLYNNATSVLEYIQFDFMPKAGTCDDCTADKCGDVPGSKVSLTLFTRAAAGSINIYDCAFNYAPRVCPAGEWTTFRATINGASTSTPLSAGGAGFNPTTQCTSTTQPWDSASVLGRNFFGGGAQPNAFGTDVIFSINIGDGITDNSGLEVYVDNIHVKYPQDGKPVDVDIYDLENEDYESCISSGTGKSKSKSKSN